MNITKQEVDELNIIVKINLEKDDYMPKVEKSIKDYSKKVNLKGFRQGKVPTGIVKKMYGQEIMAEELNRLVSDELTKYLQENNIKFLGEPMPHTEDTEVSLDVNQPREQEFIYELGLQPKIEIPAIANAGEVTKYKIRVDDNLVQAEVEQLQKRYGKMTNPEGEIKEDDVLYVHLQELDEEGSFKEGGAENKPSFPLEQVKDNKVKEKLIALKKEESVNINILRSFDYSHDEIAEKLLNTSHDALHEMNDEFKLTLLNINRVEKAEINEELFEKIYGEEVKTEEAFRNKIKEELEKILAVNSDRKLNNDIVEKLVTETEINLPEEFLKRWLLQTNKDNVEVTEETIEAEFEPFTSNLKWNLIVNRVLEDSEIKVEREDVIERTKELIKMEYGFSEGMEGMDGYLNQMAEQMMKNEDHVRKVYENVRDQKVIEYIKDKLTIKDQDISYNEFQELTKK